MVIQVFNPDSYTFSLFAVPTFLTSAALLVLGLIVLVRERISRVSILFFWIALAISIWQFAFSWMYLAKESGVALWWGKTAYLGVPFIIPAIYHFTVVVLRTYQQRKVVVWGSWAVAAVFAAAAIMTDRLINGMFHYSWGYYPKYGPLAYLFLLFFLGLMGANLLQYWKAYQKAKGIHRDRIRWLLIGMGCAYFASLDFLSKLGVPLYPAGYLPLLAWVIFAERAIWHYQLVEITPEFAAGKIIETMGDALLVLDDEGMIRVANQAACNLFQRREEDLAGKPLWTVSSDLFPWHRLDSLLHGEGLQRYEADHVRDDGLRITLELAASVIRDRMGHDTGVVCIARDITERRRAEEAEEGFQLLVESVRDYAIFMLDAGGHIVSWNAGAERIKGYSAEEIVGRHFSCFYTEEDIQRGRPHRLLMEAAAIGTATEEGRLVRKDGSEFWANVVITALRDEHGELRGFAKITRDVSERKRDEAIRLELLKKVMSAQEEERGRVARELHDTTQQSLTSLLVGLRALEDLSVVEEIRPQTTRLREATVQTMKDVRRLAYGLRPTVLDDLGLEAALKYQAREFTGTHGIPVTVLVEGLDGQRLPSSVEIALYRIVQEALTNVAKHARASSVEIRLRCRQSEAEASIEDSGCGFNVSSVMHAADPRRHLGLHGMRERVELLGGAIVLDSSPGKGTRLAIWLPLKESHAHEDPSVPR